MEEDRFIVGSVFGLRPAELPSSVEDEIERSITKADATTYTRDISSNVTAIGITQPHKNNASSLSSLFGFIII